MNRRASLASVGLVPEPEAVTACQRIVGRYGLYGAIASGGMATVHYGRLMGPVGFSRTVAIKRLRPQYAEDPMFVSMFLDEARLAGRIRHPNVVATLDVIAEDKEILLVMDYVHGESLARILREAGERKTTIPLPVALRIASDVLQGLHAAHETHDEHGNPLNIVHRDISPQNILIGIDGIARLVDFGVAKAGGRAQNTQEGHLKGKLGYMAPEQLISKGAITRQADIHAFATVLWEMLAGKRLFMGDSEADTVARIVQHEVPRLAPEGISPAVDEVLRLGLAPDLNVRFTTARAMCVALESCGPMAPSMQVGDWVQQQVGDLLKERTAIVQAIERDTGAAVEPGAAPDGGAKAAKAWVARLSVPDPDEVANVKLGEVAGAADPAKPAGGSRPDETPGPVPGGDRNSKVSTLPPPMPEEMSLPIATTPRMVVMGAAIAGAVVVLGTLWAVMSHGTSPDTKSTTSPSPSASVSSSASAAATTPAPADTGSAAPPGSASAAPPDTVPTAAPTATSTHRGSKRPKGNCDPPFTVDSQGIRVPKRECFR